jgi:hypothetical protein
MHAGFWWRNPWEGEYFEDLGEDGMIILKWMFEKWDRGHGLY